MGRSENVSYWRGEHSTIPTTRIPGRILVEEDTGDVFVEFNWYNSASGFWEVKRQQLTDTTKFNTAGGWFTGPVFLVNHPDALTEQVENAGQSSEYLAATKHYVDLVDERLTFHKDDNSRHISTYGGVSERDYWNSKVDSIPGKGLSSNDFSDELKKKLDGISEDADAVTFVPSYNTGNSLGIITINGTEFNIYTPEVTDIVGNAGTASKLQYSSNIDGIAFDGSYDISHYGVCETESKDAVKAVEIPNFAATQGASVYISLKHPDSISQDEITEETSKLYLQVNTTQFPIYYRDESLARNVLREGTYHFVAYNNTFHLVGELDTDTTYEDSTTTSSGLMSAEDKQTFEAMETKLAGIEEGANNYTLPAASKTVLGGVKVGDNVSVEPDGTISLTRDNVMSAMGEGVVVDEFTPASEQGAGSPGVVPAPKTVADNSKFLRGDATWAYLETIALTEIDAISSNLVSLNSDFADNRPYITLESDQYTFYPNKTYYFESASDLKSSYTFYFSVPEQLTLVKAQDEAILEYSLKKHFPDATVITDSFYQTSNETYLFLNSSNTIGTTGSASLIENTRYAIKIPDAYQSSTYIYLVFIPEVTIPFQPQDEKNWIRISWANLDLEESSATGTWLATSERGETLGSGDLPFGIMQKDRSVPISCIYFRVVQNNFELLEIYNKVGGVDLTTCFREAKVSVP